MDKEITLKLDKFFKKYRHKIYKKGEILIRADDDPPGIFYLVDGLVKEYAISKKGDELIVNIFKPISFFPMSYAINKSKNEYYYEATTSVDLWQAPPDEVAQFVKENPDVLYDLLSRVYKGTDGVLSRMTYLMAGNAYARLITEIIIHAKRFGKIDKDSHELKISEKDLASQTGMTRETVSREIKILKGKGLVDFDKGKLIIKDLSRLEHEIAGGV